MQLQHLTKKDVDDVVVQCQKIESLYYTTSSGVIEQHPNVADSQVSAENHVLQNILNGMSDAALAEFQALVWIGRGEDDGSNWEISLDYSRSRIDKTSRIYLSQKAPLRQYIQDGIAKTNARLV